MIFKFDFGDLVEDKVTTFQGVVCMRTQHLNGCVQYGLRSIKRPKEGKIAEMEYLDEQQLKLVQARRVKIEQRPTGGLMPKPKALPTPPH